MRVREYLISIVCVCVCVQFSYSRARARQSIVYLLSLQIAIICPETAVGRTTHSGTELQLF